jgi:hypothetical protein
VSLKAENRRVGDVDEAGLARQVRQRPPDVLGAVAAAPRPLPESVGTAAGADFSYQLPASSYQLPATSYQLPAASFQLPASSFQTSAEADAAR